MNFFEICVSEAMCLWLTKNNPFVLSTTVFVHTMAFMFPSHPLQLRCA